MSELLRGGKVASISLLAASPLALAMLTSCSSTTNNISDSPQSETPASVPVTSEGESPPATQTGTTEDQSNGTPSGSSSLGSSDDGTSAVDGQPSSNDATSDSEDEDGQDISTRVRPVTPDPEEDDSDGADFDLETVEPNFGTYEPEFSE